jgi:hypothetical protein
MTTVYEFEYARELSDEVTDKRFVGVFSTRERVNDALQMLKMLPGFPSILNASVSWKSRLILTIGRTASLHLTTDQNVKEELSFRRNKESIDLDKAEHVVDKGKWNSP